MSSVNMIVVIIIPDDIYSYFCSDLKQRKKTNKQTKGTQKLLAYCSDCQAEASGKYLIRKKILLRQLSSLLP